jgi:hypothetical protein
MSWRDVAVVVVVLLVLGLWFAWAEASRIDRLHRKVAASRIALDAQLVRRASAAQDVALSGILDPASSVVVGEAAFAVLRQGERIDDARVRAESDLSAVLRAALDDPDEVARWATAPDVAAVLAELAGAWYRAQLARRFHNEAVGQTQRIRRMWYVRLLRLAGRAPLPQTTELDDASPASLRGLTAGPSAVGEGGVGVG